MLQRLLAGVCLRSLQPAFSSVILDASTADLHPCLGTLLGCSSISSLLILCSIPKKMSKVPVYHLIYIFSVPQAEPLNKVHHTVCDGFRISRLFFSFSLFLKCYFILLFSPTVSHHSLLPSYLLHLSPSILDVFRSRISHKKFSASPSRGEKSIFQVTPCSTNFSLLSVSPFSLLFLPP